MSEDAAADAFDALRSEVALLRRAIEGLSAQQPEPPSDYAPTLGRIEKATVNLGERVEALAANPSLQLTPETMGEQFRGQARVARDEAHQQFAAAIASVTKAGAALTTLSHRVRAQDAQLKWVLYSALGGAVVALLAWITLSGPLIRALPASWQLPERTAASVLQQDRWAAGVRLLQSADVDAWRQLQLAEVILTQNRNALDVCLKRAERLKQSVTCEVRVGG